MTFMICLSNGNVKTSAGFLFIDDVKTLDTRTISLSQEHIPYTEATSAVVQPVMARNSHFWSAGNFYNGTAFYRFQDNVSKFQM